MGALPSEVFSFSGFLSLVSAPLTEEHQPLTPKIRNTMIFYLDSASPGYANRGWCTQEKSRLNMNHPVRLPSFKGHSHCSFCLVWAGLQCCQIIVLYCSFMKVVVDKELVQQKLHYHLLPFPSKVWRTWCPERNSDLQCPMVVIG